MTSNSPHTIKTIVILHWPHCSTLELTFVTEPHHLTRWLSFIYSKLMPLSPLLLWATSPPSFPFSVSSISADSCSGCWRRGTGIAPGPTSKSPGFLASGDRGASACERNSRGGIALNSIHSLTSLHIRRLPLIWPLHCQRSPLTLVSHIRSGSSRERSLSRCPDIRVSNPLGSFYVFRGEGFGTRPWRIGDCWRHKGAGEPCL